MFGSDLLAYLYTVASAAFIGYAICYAIHRPDKHGNANKNEHPDSH